MVIWQEFYVRLNTILKISLCLKLQCKIIVISCSCNCCVQTSTFNLSSNEGITVFRFSVSCGHIVHEYAVCIVVAWKMYNSKKKSILMFVSSSFIVSSIYSFFFFLKCLLASHRTLFPLCTLLLLGSCNHCSLACLLWSRNCEHSLSNHGLCCFWWYRPRLSSAEILIFSLMFSHALFTSLLSLKFSKAANLFEILIWHCFLTSSSLSFLRLNLSMSNVCAARLLTASLPWLLQLPESDQYHSQLPWKIM